MSSSVEITQRRLAATARGVGIMCDFYAERAENAENPLTNAL